MNRFLLVAIISAVALLGLLSLLVSDKPAGSSANVTPVMVYCAASNRAVVEAIRADYEKETGRTVEIQYGPSQSLLSSIEISNSGDLFIPADDSFIAMAQQKKLVSEVIPLAVMQGVVAVQKGNPKAVHAFSDLLRSEVRVVQASAEAAAIGSLTRQVLQEQQLWEQLDQSTTAHRTTVTEVASDIVVGAADAGIVYDAVLHAYPDLEFVVLPELKDLSARVCVGVLSESKQTARALHFGRYLAASDRGLRRYAEHGFRIEEGDIWADQPELSVFAGSMLRPAIDRTITLFEEREGIRVNRVYNGCGILVAQMKAGQVPDAYFACDREFMEQVPDLFPESVEVSQNELVILVQKGNPHGIASLKDLTKEGLRVGIGHEKQCAMGWLTQNTLREGGVQAEVMANVTVQTPTGDMLVNQLKTGSLDAAVAYLSNAAGSADVLDAIQIQGIPCSVAVQPFAVAEKSLHRRLAGRLFEKICSTESQQDFTAEGFQWRVGQPTEGSN